MPTGLLVLTSADRADVQAELAQLHAWRSRNEWRSNRDAMYQLQRQVNDRHIARLEAMLKEEK